MFTHLRGRVKALLCAHLYCFLHFQEMSLEGRQNDELNRNKNQTVTAAKKMEKLVVLVGLIVHIKKKNRCHVLIAFSVGCQSYRLLRSEEGHSLFFLLTFGNDLVCVSLFFWTYHSNV